MRCGRLSHRSRAAEFRFGANAVDKITKSREHLVGRDGSVIVLTRHAVFRSPHEMVGPKLALGTDRGVLGTSHHFLKDPDRHEPRI
jgi:hypothetical protein